MQKILLTIIGIVLFFSSIQAQHFDTYFEPKTLRLDYVHTGNLEWEFITPVEYWEKTGWEGTKNRLIDSSNLGSLIFQIYDSLTQQLIFSKSYSTLFEEYRTTEKGKTEIVDYLESIVFPKPKNTVKIVFESLDRRLQKQEVTGFYWNPQKTKTTKMTKKHNVLDLHIGGTNETCLNIVIVPDGYSKKESAKLKADMARIGNYILECTPFKENKQNINIRGIEGYSKHSGITDPNAKIFKKTLIGTSFNTIDVDRYLMCQDVWKLHEVADDAPYDAILILANTKKYGGGGIYNFYATVYSDGDEKRIAYVTVHELGHSVGGLGDEYYTSEVSVQDFYPLDIEPAEPNLTTLVNFEAKWKSLLSPDTPVPTPNDTTFIGVLGVFEGGGYCAKGVYRPWLNCTMKESIYNNFCPVCKYTLERAINKKK